MIKQTIEELRKIKEVMIGYDGFTQDDLYTIDKAIIACEQLQKARKKTKRWKRKYLNAKRIYEETAPDRSKECNYCKYLETQEKCYKCYHNHTDKFNPILKGEPNERPTNRKSNGWY